MEIHCSKFIKWGKTLKKIMYPAEVKIELNKDLECPCSECDGHCCSRFSAVDITEEEAKFLESKYPGSTNKEKNNWNLEMRLNNNTCVKLKDGKCSIYEDRPNVCRRFRCIDMYCYNPRDVLFNKELKGKLDKILK